MEKVSLQLEYVRQENIFSFNQEGVSKEIC